MVDDYELLPHEELERLRREVEHLKKNPYSGNKKNQNLLDSMDSLTSSINRLIAIFEGTQEGLIKEYKDASPTKLLVKISEENAKIAEGIVAVAEMLKGDRPMQSRRPMTSNMPPPPTRSSEQMPSPPGMGELRVPDVDFEPEKKGLFGKFRK
ncbi:MAG: hypothetical protein ABH828_00750 [archaeon]